MAVKGKKRKNALIKLKPPPRQRASDFMSRYANGVVIVNTQFDIQLIFGQLDFQPNRQFVINEHTLIAMSPKHAKSLFELLGKRLKDWENSYGEIKLKQRTLGDKSK